jgi:hypothetical protein
LKIALATACSVAIGLLAVAPAAAADSPIPAADHAAIGVLIDHFVKDVVKRQDLAAGWLLADHNLRAGTTRAAWIQGTGVSVPSFPARGADFHNAWTGTLVSPGRAILALMLFPAKGHKDTEQTAMTVDVRRVGGRWVVDELYTSATFGSYGVKGPADYGPAGNKALAVGSSQLAQRLWLYGVLLGVGALVVGVPAGFFVAAKRRDRRAYRAYVATLGPGDTARG